MKQSEQRILNFYDIYNFIPEEVYNKALLILSAYRFSCWDAANRSDEQRVLLGIQSDCIAEAVVSWEAFVREKECARLDAALSELYRSAKLTETVDKIIQCIRDFPGDGKTYFNILSKKYINLEELNDTQIQKEIGLASSQYFQRKKEAVLLFGLVLWLQKNNIN